MTCSSYCARFCGVSGTDDDRPVVQHLVEVRVGRQNKVECLLERHPVNTERHFHILELFVIRDVDARDVTNEVDDILEAAVAELERERVARRRVQ